MKKQYHKPYLLVEPYQLDGSAVASCSSQGYAPIHFGETEANCGRGGEPGNWQFYGDVSYCILDVTPEEGEDPLCYHGPVYSGGVTFVYS